MNPGHDTIAIVVPTRNEAATIGPICTELAAIRDAGWCERVLVVDESDDASGPIAAAAGADVIRQSMLRPEAGPVLGKGDAMWRALDAVEEDVVVFVDGDTRAFDPALARDLITASAQPGAWFVKAAYERPWDDGRTRSRHGGGRVTELTAKPLLRQLFPVLARFDQPLAGEIAVRTELLRSLAFVTGYGVDVALLIDALRAVGPDGLREVWTAPRQNRHRPLEELALMADEVASTILGRAGVVASPLVERPARAREPLAA